MAITTINDKLALIEYGDIFQPGIPISTDGLDQADNQQLLWEYPGILWRVEGVALIVANNQPYYFIAKEQAGHFVAKGRPYHFAAEVN